MNKVIIVDRDGTLLKEPYDEQIVTSSSRPISWRYLSNDALSRLVMDFVIFNCLIYLK